MSTATDILLPDTATPLERDLAALSAPLDALDPRVIETIWDAWRCPAAMLPHLAWALSVDIWEDDWDEVRKRRTIAESPAYHRRKGTRAAIEHACSFVPRAVQIVEWHERVPAGRRGTFEIRLALGESETTLDLIDHMVRLKRLVTAAKPKSRAFAITAARTQSTTVPLSVGIGVVMQARLDVPVDKLMQPVVPSVGVSALETTELGVL